MKRGRPKGRSSDKRSYGPLGDLIRKHRLEKKLGLSDVAKACRCSVQFISNIEHGRAPLPWDKIPQLSNYLRVALEEVQAANLSVRSDFKSFVKNGKGAKPKSTASIIAASSRDSNLLEIIQKYQIASTSSRKRFVKAALKLLSN